MEIMHAKCGDYRGLLVVHGHSSALAHATYTWYVPAGSSWLPTHGMVPPGLRTTVGSSWWLETPSAESMMHDSATRRRNKARQNNYKFYLYTDDCFVYINRNRYLCMSIYIDSDWFIYIYITITLYCIPFAWYNLGWWWRGIWVLTGTVMIAWAMPCHAGGDQWFTSAWLHMVSSFLWSLDLSWRLYTWNLTTPKRSIFGDLWSFTTSLTIVICCTYQHF